MNTESTSTLETKKALLGFAHLTTKEAITQALEQASYQQLADLAYKVERNEWHAVAAARPSSSPKMSAEQYLSWCLSHWLFEHPQNGLVIKLDKDGEIKRRHAVPVFDFAAGTMALQATGIDIMVPDISKPQEIQISLTEDLIDFQVTAATMDKIEARAKSAASDARQPKAFDKAELDQATKNSLIDNDLGSLEANKRAAAAKAEKAKLEMRLKAYQALARQMKPSTQRTRVAGMVASALTIAGIALMLIAAWAVGLALLGAGIVGGLAALRRNKRSKQKLKAFKTTLSPTIRAAFAKYHKDRQEGVTAKNSSDTSSPTKAVLLRSSTGKASSGSASALPKPQPFISSAARSIRKK